MKTVQDKPTRKTSIKADAATAFIDLLTHLTLKQRQQRNGQRKSRRN
ncbi:hypothetical protein [Thalassolituus marinus]|jgi:hypothetical protein|uniref:Transposase n=1 Tax=Thalassolituus marinus TaxID=671053 RepID=A0ABS7ZWW3_9GAMM|nr:hypothetical protein [Thalassolituus marinus]MCA6064865.1 hypothetical protein [Thalassolituus marinus]